MKRTFTLSMGVLLFVLGACKREQEVLPQNDEKLAISNERTSMTTAAVTPLLVAGQKGSAGFVNGTGSAARFDIPGELFVDGDGSLYVCDYQNLAIRKISIQNKVTTLNIDPDTFGGLLVNDGPASVAVLDNGTVGIQSPGHILLYRNGAVFKDLTGSFGGIDEGQDGASFNFISNGYDTAKGSYYSKLGVIKNDAYYGPLKVISNSSTANYQDTRSNVIKYVIIDGRIFKLTSTGSTEAFPALNLPATSSSVAGNKAGTDVYFTINYGDIKRVRNNKLETIITGVKATGIALSNSEKYLYYTSQDNTVNRILLP